MKKNLLFWKGKVLYFLEGKILENNFIFLEKNLFWMRNIWNSKQISFFFFFL